MNKTDMNEDSKNIWKVLKTEPENCDTTSLYLDSEGNDKSFSKRRAGHYPTLRVMGEDGWSEPHRFAVSCAPEDKILRLTIKRAGKFTSSIPGLMY